MKGRWLWLVISANLLVLIALVFAFPHLMISPGPLIEGHTGLATDCFACHAPLRGATSSRCVECHAVADIGLLLTTGAPVQRTPTLDPKSSKVAFHQALIEDDCMACHSDHAGPRLTHHSRKPFSHTLLRAATRDRCEACHAAPENAVHRDLKIGCVQCHSADAWKPAHFDHAALPSAQLERCESCHKKPSDSLHKQISGNCSQCHGSDAWTPATFEHDKLFLLDRDHNATCVTCHVDNNYATYTCYGCHEHTVANIRQEHVEEGIRNFDNCVECHRSADDEPDGRDSGRRDRKRD